MFALIGLDQAHQVSDGVVNVIKYVAPRFAIRAVVLIKFQGRRRLHMRCGATIDISASNVDSGKSRISCLRSIPRLISAKMPVVVATPGTVNGKTSNRRMILTYVEQFARYIPSLSNVAQEVPHLAEQRGRVFKQLDYRTAALEALLNPFCVISAI